MRRSSLVLVTLLTACGTTPAPVDDGPDTGGGEARQACPEPAIHTTREGTPQTLDGEWFVVEADDEDVELTLDLQGHSGTARRPRGGDERIAQVRVEAAEGELQRLVLSATDRNETLSLLWSFAGDGRALVFRPDDDDLAIAFRGGPVPEELRGRWMVAEPNDDEMIAFEVTADRVRAERETERYEGRAWAVNTDGETLGLVVSQERRGRERMTMVRFSRIGTHLYLTWENGDDDYRVMYRPGNRPAWLAERRDPGLQTSVEAAPPP